MPTGNHEQRVKKLIEISASHSRGNFDEFLDSGLMKREQIRKATQLARDALYELFSDAPNEKRMSRKLKEAIMIYLELEIERQVDDTIQAQAVKLLRENVIRRSEKEKLAEELAALAVERWKTLSEDELETVADDETGLLDVILSRTEIRVSADDEELHAALVELGKILARPFISSFTPAAFDNLVGGAARVCGLAASGKSAVEPLQQTAIAAMEASGIIKVMRRSFSGLLLGDLILRQVGKSLGIKEKISVSDFIIYLGCMIADKQLLPETDKAELRQLETELQSV